MVVDLPCSVVVDSLELAMSSVSKVSPRKPVKFAVSEEKKGLTLYSTNNFINPLAGELFSHFAKCVYGLYIHQY